MHLKKRSVAHIPLEKPCTRALEPRAVEFGAATIQIVKGEDRRLGERVLQTDAQRRTDKPSTTGHEYSLHAGKSNGYAQRISRQQAVRSGATNLSSIDG